MKNQLNGILVLLTFVAMSNAMEHNPNHPIVQPGEEIRNAREFLGLGENFTRANLEDRRLALSLEVDRNRAYQISQAIAALYPYVSDRVNPNQNVGNSDSFNPAHYNHENYYNNLEQLNSADNEDNVGMSAIFSSFLSNNSQDTEMSDVGSNVDNGNLDELRDLIMQFNTPTPDRPVLDYMQPRSQDRNDSLFGPLGQGDEIAREFDTILHPRVNLNNLIPLGEWIPVGTTSSVETTIDNDVRLGTQEIDILSIENQVTKKDSQYVNYYFDPNTGRVRKFIKDVANIRRKRKRRMTNIRPLVIDDEGDDVSSDEEPERDNGGDDGAAGATGTGLQ